MREAAMRLIHDAVVAPVTHAHLKRAETLYHLRLYVPTAPVGRLPVAVATELSSNPGLSITNCCEELAAAVMAYLWAKGHRYEMVHWVEHYEDNLSYGRSRSRPDLPSETFALVTFDPGDTRRGGDFALRNPYWRHFTIPELEALIAMPWEPVCVPGLPEPSDRRDR